MKQAFLLIFLLIALLSKGQNESDISRYASQYFLGTARYTGLSGAMGALGGDMTSIHINPASVAVYRFGDISFTPAFEMNSLQANSTSGSESTDASKLVVNSAGFVLANETNNPNWKLINFSISFNRLNTYNDNLFHSNELSNNQSLQQDFVDESNGLTVSELSEYSALLAYDAFITDLIKGDSTQYIGRIPGDIVQLQTAERNGRHTETALSFGANYQDRLFLGASLGIQNVNYTLDVETREAPSDVTTIDLQEYAFNEQLTIQGLGVNFKLGAIYRANKFLRIGGSIQTPTVLNLTDNFINSISARYVNPVEFFDYESPAGTFQYKVRTPWRFMGSVAGVIGKKAIVSAQYEYTNFQGGELRTSSTYSDADFSFPNQVAQENFGEMHILRTGAEFRITPAFYLRGGFGYFTNPIAGNERSDVDLDRIQYTGGLGYKKAVWSIDLSYQLVQFEELYQSNFSAPSSVLKASYSTIAFSIGMRI